MKRIFYVVVIDTPDVMGIVGLVEEVDWKPWKWHEENRNVADIERSAIEKGYTVTYQNAHALPSWAFVKLMDCVVARYRQSFPVANALDVEWEVFHRVVVYPEKSK